VDAFGRYKDPDFPADATSLFVNARKPPGDHVYNTRSTLPLYNTPSTLPQFAQLVQFSFSKSWDTKHAQEQEHVIVRGSLCFEQMNKLCVPFRTHDHDHAALSLHHDCAKLRQILGYRNHIHHIFACVCACVHVCVCMYVWMHACMYLCVNVYTRITNIACRRTHPSRSCTVAAST
jgi:hypothetical protein